MIWLMVVLLFAGALFMVCCALYGIIKLKDNKLEKPQRCVLLLSAGTVASYATAMIMSDAFWARLFFGICTFLECFAVLAVFNFTRKYLGYYKNFRKKGRAINILAIIDMILMLVNSFADFVFKVEPYYFGSGSSVYRISEFEPIYSYHLVFLIAVGVVILIMLISKIINLPSAYAVKYFSLFLALGGIAIVSTSHVCFRLKFDYSLLFHAIAGFLTFYYSLIYIPRGLIDRLMLFTIANMNDGIMCVDVDGKVIYSNKASEIFCFADSEIETLEQQVEAWFADKINKNTATLSWDIQRNVNGTARQYSVEYRKIFDSSLKYLGCFFLIHDKTEEHTKYCNEKYRATHDLLTGLYNKNYFCDSVREILNSKPDESYCIIVTDVKNFKIVNDVFGVEAGDRLLKKIAEVTSSVGGKNCIYGRISGDRFAVFMPKEIFSESELLEAYSVLDSFMEKSAFKTHIHIGVYEVTDPNLRVSVMCDRANLAIKTIKDSYRSVVAYYDRSLREKFINEHRVISEFERALTEGQFRLYIQPQTFAEDGRVEGGEALVRWFHPEDGMIPPDSFIKIFEHTGLISRLDMFMWETACAYLRKWADMGLENTYISVNISQKDFFLIDVYDVITSLVEKYELSPKRLHLEITETAMMDNPTAQLELIARLRSEGFIVEIDDFGSGYSSLNMLKDFDADVLKIDMGFLRKTEHQERSHAILKTIISLAKFLDMEVITEGVETQVQVDFLAEYGCDIYQGYFFAKPMPVEEFEEKYISVSVEV
ncbi:MAG: EAL domain-containing protein [Ruminococcus flavefaciens]|nr:EAL domain-containing protein [Ruminococcus flavefaciens]MCM1231384.1 EAL domain-containing protein [Ruminococcus flavefaciens]